VNKEKAALPRLYCIIDRETLDARAMSVGVFARELRDAGVRLVQYRDKVGGPQEVLRVAAEISAVFEGVEATLMMNDRADLATSAGWSGVHVGQGDLLPEDARRVIGAGDRAAAEKIRGSLHSAVAKSATAPVEMTDFWGTKVFVGVSTHTEEQVGAADAGVADYVAVGPVFGTSTKLDAEPVVGLEGVRRARALTRKPLVAIGGITLENARSVVDAGADSVAVIGGLFVEGRTVGEVVRDFLEILR
jgi:thiamine-phosphate pyrophosphorylase